MSMNRGRKPVYRGMPKSTVFDDFPEPTIPKSFFAVGCGMMLAYAAMILTIIVGLMFAAKVIFF